MPPTMNATWNSAMMATSARKRPSSATPVRHRRGVRDLGRSRLAVLPHQLTREERDEQEDDGRAPAAQDRPATRCVTGQVDVSKTVSPTFQPQSSDEPDRTRAGPRRNARLAVDLRERVARDGERLPHARPRSPNDAGDARHRHRPVPLGCRARRRLARRACAGGRRRRACANRKRAVQQREHRRRDGEPEQRGSTPASRESRSSRVFRSAAVQYRSCPCSALIPSGSASAESIGFVDAAPVVQRRRGSR